MKRKIEVSTPHVRIVAVLDTQKELAREQVERVRDDLADRLMDVASDIRYLRTPLSRVRVR